MVKSLSFLIKMRDVPPEVGQLMASMQMLSMHGWPVTAWMACSLTSTDLIVCIQLSHSCFFPSFYLPVLGPRDPEISIHNIMMQNLICGFNELTQFLFLTFEHLVTLRNIVEWPPSSCDKLIRP